MRKPRILIFIGSLRPGGKERRLIELLTYLKRKDLYELLLVLTKNEIYYSVFHQLGINHTVIQKRWRKNDITVFQKFYKICRQFEPDIIHAWGRMQAFYSIPVVIGQKRPLINSQITGAPPNLPRISVGRLIDSINFQFSALVLANSLTGLEVYKPPRSKRRLIYNGLNLARFENLPPVEEVKRKYGIVTPYAVVMVASYSPAKDYDLFVRVAENVTALRNDISFVGAGGCDQEHSAFTKMKNRCAGNRQILFHSQVEDVEALINCCTIGVLFSTNGEGTSNAILEYMALGKAVIASDAGGNGALISNNENGHLVSGQNVEEIGKIIMRLIDDTEKLNLMGANNKKKIRDYFSLETMGREFEKAYEDVRLQPGMVASQESVITNTI